MTNQQVENTQNQDQVSAMLTVLEMIFTSLAKEAKASLQYKAMGVDTTFTQRLKESLTKEPYQKLLDFGVKINAKIDSALAILVAKHLESFKTQLSSVKFETENPLHFFIALKNDSASARSEVNSFFDFYYLTNYSEQFPIIFTYTNNNRLDKIEGLQTIDFSE